MQLTHEENPFIPKKFPVILVCDHILFQQNIGALFRIADAFGVEKIIFLGKNISLNYRKINKTSRNTHTLVPYEVVESFEELQFKLKSLPHKKIALEITDSSYPVEQLPLQPETPVILFIGGEINGLSPEILDTVTETVHVTMYGKNSSMNVVQATAVALYEITKKLVSSRFKT